MIENVSNEQNTHKDEKGITTHKKLTYADIVKGKKESNNQSQWAMTITLINYY